VVLTQINSHLDHPEPLILGIGLLCSHNHRFCRPILPRCCLFSLHL